MFFWNKKEQFTTTIHGIKVIVDSEELVDLLITIAGIGNETRKDFNELRKAHKLVLDHLKLKYVPETETNEPAKLVDITASLGDIWCTPTGSFSYDPAYFKDAPKKKGRPKKK